MLPQRGMWVWNTAQLFADPPQMDRLVVSANSINISDIYLYIAPSWWDQRSDDIAHFNTRMYNAGIRTWALDGDRAYVNDPEAQALFLQSLECLGQFNQRAHPSARFYGFHADVEPQDSAGHEPTFHNGLSESRLEPLQRASRDGLLLAWLDILTRAGDIVRSHGLHYGAALPFWLHDYEGEPLTVPSPKGFRTCIMDLIMPLLDEYVVMSYNTTPTTAATEIRHQAKYASEQTRAGRKMPRILGAVETGSGVGRGVSYGDTPGKQSRAVVLDDMGKIEANLSGFQSFGGMAIHHWSAWDALPR